jgi:hypothetical protein
MSFQLPVDDKQTELSKLFERKEHTGVFPTYEEVEEACHKDGIEVRHDGVTVKRDAREIWRAGFDERRAK